ncbi:uncharacterized protein F4807DRAFT_470612 [Annulohypoxylon truncatum]|uniref:uncharacterized protein n=1 Tax=Annulohypoxylon truncatum TaxID=327061 RepID=UPI0020073E7B|nr:uncharacterized protein F4807DRAFT_470612 [Annulohypoxylon truncatum]KAI1205840.1 hypothetical protein F4807DRAFT_470612 [Annulohypoxylon truncatum]
MASGSGFRPNLPYLPWELITRIVSDPQFSRQDLKNFRLICPSFEQPVSSILFQRVKLSRLAKDREAFEAIAASPHLAKHVRQIVWQELNLEAWDAPDNDDDYWIPEHTGPEPTKAPSDAPSVDSEASSSTCSFVHPNVSLDNVTRLMNAAAKDPNLFWIPISRNPPQQMGAVTYPNVSTFLTRLSVAIKKMPNLEAIRTCPMPHDRVIHYRGYPLRADLYRYKSDLESRHGQTGVFNFLLPIMGQAGNKITSLHWADEPTNDSFLLNLRPAHSQAFERLTSIDLCIAGTGNTLGYSPQGLVSCLSAAKNLKHLSLCFERTALPEPMINAIFQCYWPHLESFELSNAMLIQPPTYRPFFKKHAGSLRHLRLVMCDILTRHLIAIQRSAKLHLETVKLVRFHTDDVLRFPEKEVVEILNKTNRFNPILGFLFPEPPSRTYIVTEIAKYDHHAWCMAGVGYGPFDVRHYEHLYDEAAMDSDEGDDYDDTDTSSDSSSDPDDDYDAMDYDESDYDSDEDEDDEEDETLDDDEGSDGEDSDSSGGDSYVALQRRWY